MAVEANKKQFDDHAKFATQQIAALLARAGTMEVGLGRRIDTALNQLETCEKEQRSTINITEKRLSIHDEKIARLQRESEWRDKSISSIEMDLKPFKDNLADIKKQADQISGTVKENFRILSVETRDVKSKFLLMDSDVSACVKRSDRLASDLEGFEKRVDKLEKTSNART